MGNMIHHDNKPWKKILEVCPFLRQSQTQVLKPLGSHGTRHGGLWAQRCGFLNLKKRWVIMSFLNKKGFRIVFGFFLARVLDFFGRLSSYHLPCICNSLELESVILHGICYIWHGYFAFCTVFATFWQHLAMFAFHFSSYLPRFGTSTSHLHGICYILVLQTFMWVSREFL